MKCLASGRGGAAYLSALTFPAKIVQGLILRGLALLLMRSTPLRKDLDHSLGQQMPDLRRETDRTQRLPIAPPIAEEPAGLLCDRTQSPN